VAIQEQRAQDYQSQTPGAKDGLAPSIEFTNSNPRGNNYIKFDGVAVENINGVPTTVLIDRKISVTSKTDQKAALDRMSGALRQNPQVKGVIEVPTQAKADRTTQILRDINIRNIQVRVAPEASNP
jgi:filamentous hemagglutinin